MSRRQPIPLPRVALAIGVAGAAVLAVTGSPTTGLSPSLDARAAAAATTVAKAPTTSSTSSTATAAQADPAPTATPVPGTSPSPTATPEALSAKERRTRVKAQALAASLAEDVAGYSRADVRRGIPVTFSLGTGRAVVRLQVRAGERWANVARLNLPRGKGKRTLKPGPEGLRRLASATVDADRVRARYAVALNDGSVDASAWKSFRLNR